MILVFLIQVRMNQRVIQEFADKVDDIIDAVTDGQEFKLPNGENSYLIEDFGDGDGQYLEGGDVFAYTSKEKLRRKLLDMLDMESLNEEKIKDMVKQKNPRKI